MDIDELIAQELLDAHPSDLEVIRKYVAWVKFRRQMNRMFYPAAHWLLPAPKPKPAVHWVGRS